MRIGMIGAGRMGGNMARRLARHGHEVVVVDHDPSKAARLAAEDPAIDHAAIADDLHGLLPARRVVWIMLPAGPPTADTVAQLSVALEAGDILVNGGNCRPADTLEYAQTAAAHGLCYLDAGVSGGVWGLDNGYCLMVGGPEDVCAHVEPVFEALAADRGYARVGEVGAGHFAKMVHNGIEYALLQSYAEGFDLLGASPYDYDLGALADVWRNGSVVRSWLLDLVAQVLADGGGLEDVLPHVEDSGEGRWTIEAGVEHAIPLPAISAALFTRFASRRESFGDRLIAALREQFGGHPAHRGDGR